MTRRILARFVAPLLIVGAFCLPPAFAQEKIGRAADVDNSSVDRDKNEKTPALQYLVAGLYFMLIMVVVCAPSRKA